MSKKSVKEMGHKSEKKNPDEFDDNEMAIIFERSLKDLYYTLEARVIR
jgi:hypothetical protein